MREQETEILKAGGGLAAIGLGGRRYAAAFREEAGIAFPLLVDHDRRAYKTAALGTGSLSHLLRRDNREARRRAKAAGHSQHKLGKDPFQLGGSFVFAPGNRDLYGHVSETFGDNASLAELLKAVQQER